MVDAPETFEAVIPPDWAMFGWMSDVRPALGDMLAHGAAGVLATLYAVEGGAPRPIGSQILIAEGDMHGFLSGGCIEGDIAAHAVDVLKTGRAERLVYGDGGFADIRLVCGGRVDILLERVTAEDAAAARLIEAYRARRQALWASDGHARICVFEGPEASPMEAGLAAGLRALSAHPQAVCASLGRGRGSGAPLSPGAPTDRGRP